MKIIVSCSPTRQKGAYNCNDFLMCVFRRAAGKVSTSSCSSMLLDSDSEEEVNKKANVSRKRRLSDCLPDEDDRPEEVGAP